MKKKYLIQIREELSKCVEVEVDVSEGLPEDESDKAGANMALAKAREMYNAGEVVLDANDFVGTDMTCVGKEDASTPSGWRGVVI